MLKKLIALGAMAAATMVPATAVSATAAPQAAAPANVAANCGGLDEPPCMPTQAQVTVDSCTPGAAVKLTISARANGARVPKGDIAVRVVGNSGGGGGQAVTTRLKASTTLFQTTVHFTGDPITISGPALPKGTYQAVAGLTPDDSAYFFPSKRAVTFKAGFGCAAPGDPADNGSLPDTGGPAMMWLLLGSGLVLSGAGSVVYARRREPAAA